MLRVLKKHTFWTFDVRYLCDHQERRNPEKEHHGMRWYSTVKNTNKNYSVSLFYNHESEDYEEDPINDPIPLHRRRRVHFDWSVTCLDSQKTLICESTNNKCTNLFNGCSSCQPKFNLAELGPKFRLDLTVYEVLAPKVSDYFEEKRWTDLVLVVGNQEFHVEKDIIESHSSQMTIMETPENFRSVLDNVDPDELQELLDVIHTERGVTGGNCVELLNLADKLEMRMIKHNCGVQLIKAEISMKEKLMLADKYHHFELMEHCMKSLKSIPQIQEATPKNIQDLSPETVAKLLEKTFEVYKIAN